MKGNIDRRINSYFCTPLPSINDVISCSKKSEDHSSLKPLVLKKVYSIWCLEHWSIAQFSSLDKLTQILPDWWSSFHNFSHFCNAKSKFLYCAKESVILQGCSWVYFTKQIFCSFLLEGLEEYYSFQDKTAG